MSALFISSDLLFASTVQAAARRAGVALRVVRAVSELHGALDDDDPPRLVILDLTSAAGDLAAVLAEVRARPAPPRVVAYAPHVMKQRLQSARDAGCDQVLTRGQFHTRVDDVLASAR
jgi:DNA-binding NarL/FixJ family response regulator